MNIESVSGTASKPELELSQSVNATLLNVARRNELIISYVRAVALAGVTVLDYLLHAQPGWFKLPYAFPIAVTYVAGAWLLIALAITWTLRAGWYRPWLRRALPFVDGLIILSLNAVAYVEPSTPEAALALVVNTGIACAVVAVSGALRLSSMASWVTTGLALVIFVSAAMGAEVPIPVIIFSCSLLAAAGFLGMWMAAIVRGSLESEIARVVLMRFLPEEVVAAAHRQPLSLLTSARNADATVLVSDLRGFTAFAERLPPEQVLARLGRIQETIADVVRVHGGRIDKFMGDGMLAVFGLDDRGGTHARQAVRTAVDIVRAVRGLPVDGSEQLDICVAIHSGPLVAGCIGSGLHLEFTVIGDTVNTAARLQTLTRDLKAPILASRQTVERLGPDEGDSGWQIEALGSFDIRGRRAPLDIYAVAVSNRGGLE